MPFRNRSDAGRCLAARLSGYADGNVVVLALPRGGVPVAAEVAGALNAPLDVILVRKLAAPANPELAMGAVAEGDPPVVVRDESLVRYFGVDEATFEEVLARELDELTRRRGVYTSGRAQVDVGGRTAIVVDDGVATGATMQAALHALRRRGAARLVVAVPVADASVLQILRGEADEVVCLQDRLVWNAIGPCYDDFRQLTDVEVTETLARFAGSQIA